LGSGAEILLLDGQLRIPRNPNPLEQRMGRIHRYGQQKEVHIYNLVASDTREGKVLEATISQCCEKV
jgi:hypothetical protein